MYYTFRVASLEQQIRPVTSMNAVIIDKSWIALIGQRFTMSTFYIVGGTIVSIRIDTELILTTRGTDRRYCINKSYIISVSKLILIIITVSLAFATMHGPVIVAVVVHSALAIKQQPVFTLFHGQRAICTQEEQVTGLRVRVRLNTMLFRALRGVLEHHAAAHCEAHITRPVT